ncbi:MAG: hypothetical protein L0Z50_30135 [Verrucomicrobiales bacterium]|nr:hypothetical protein [Verrucomicrobiales bacterium]
MKTELRLTDTNAASDSAGRTWGLDGNLFWWVVGGLGVGITIFFVMVVGFKSGLFLSFGVAATPVLLCLGYILTLRQGKPPGYDRDVIERLFTSDGFSPDSKSLTHPIAKE